ncbi:sodium-dependent transporter [bacterium]|nr:sodium-dependent transporter [bacterium]
MTQGRGHWRSRIGFVWAAAGSAVGLGNIWRFPYLAGENGGSMFIVVYLLCIVVLGLPIIIAEIMLGKTAQRDPVGVFRKLAGDRSSWQLVGFMGVLAAFVILSFYSVVAGWCINFIYHAAIGEFEAGHTMTEIQGVFQQLTASPKQQILCHLVFLVMTVGIVVAGVQRGLQRWNEILMPALLVILVVLVGYALTLDGAGAGFRFVLQPDPSKLSWDAVLKAMGQCFFSLSLGMGAMMTYGSYLRPEDRVPGAAVMVVLTDTAIALLAGLVIFPIVFSFGQEPGQGPGLVFVTLPAAFLQMPGGTWVALGFFGLLLCAAITSAISLLEVITAYFVDEYQMPRALAAWMFGLICFLMGCGCAYSGGYFDFLDQLASNYLLPLGGLFIALYAGWRLDKTIAQNEFRGTWYAGLFPLWRACVRVIAPALVAIVFLNALGLLDKLFPGQ